MQKSKIIEASVALGAVVALSGVMGLTAHFNDKQPRGLKAADKQVRKILAGQGYALDNRLTHRKENDTEQLVDGWTITYAVQFKESGEKSVATVRCGAVPLLETAQNWTCHVADMKPAKVSR